MSLVVLRRLDALEDAVEALRVEIDALKTALEARKRNRELTDLVAESVGEDVPVRGRKAKAHA